MHNKNAQTVMVGLLIFLGILFVWSIDGSAQNSAGDNSQNRKVVVTPVIKGTSPGVTVSTNPDKPAGLKGARNPSGGQNPVGNSKRIIPKITPQASPVTE